MSDERKQYRLPETGDAHRPNNGPSGFDGKRFALANLAGLITGLLLMGIGKVITSRYETIFVAYGWSVFLTVPLAMGLVMGLAFGREEVRRATLFLSSLLLPLVGIACSMLFFREGIICVIMAFPLIWAATLIGVGIGRLLIRYTRRDRTYAIAAPLLLATIGVDALLPKTFVTSVTTVSQPIHATPAQLWPEIVSMGRIPETPTYWLCKIGLPAPVEVIAESPVVGAKRDCIFTGGLVFGEVITIAEKDQHLKFKIVSQPRDPEILGHADVLSGEMRLRPNPDGTTTIIGTSHYALHVFPAAYFDLWAKSIGHAVHERVFEHIKKRVTRS
jgi:hypothetical protein